MTISDGLADANSPILAAVGGAILNRASLVLSKVVVSDSQALGDASKSPLTPGFPGGGFGGGVASFGVLTVEDSSFIDNLARGGDGSRPQGADRPTAGSVRRRHCQLRPTHRHSQQVQAGTRPSAPTTVRAPSWPATATAVRLPAAPRGHAERQRQWIRSQPGHWRKWQHFSAARSARPKQGFGWRHQCQRRESDYRQVHPGAQLVCRRRRSFGLL